MYTLLRAIAGIALRWYYRDIQVEGLERVPREGPILLAVNHPNALVDALLVGWIVPRRVLITAKSTLFNNPVAGALLRFLGVVPLRRASDAARAGEPLHAARNRKTFEAVHDALRLGGAVLIFPEGRTHDEPSLAPLKTGAARMALHARDAGDVPGLTIVPIGLTFERKESPRSRVLVQIGEPILVQEWRAPKGAAPADALTMEIETRLRAVTLNYRSADDATRAVRLASLVAALFDQPRSGPRASRRLGDEAAIARRIDELGALLAHADARLRARADELVVRLDTVHQVAAQNDVLIEDIGVSLDRRRAFGVVVREIWLFAVGGPIAIWGRINHWLPFGAARFIAMRSVESAADPAMRTLVAGTVLVLLAYLAQTAVVSAIWGTAVGIAYVVSLPVAAEINFVLSDRLRREVFRARAFMRFRQDPALHRRLAGELTSLRADVLAFERSLTQTAEARSP